MKVPTGRSVWLTCGKSYLSQSADDAAAVVVALPLGLEERVEGGGSGRGFGGGGLGGGGRRGETARRGGALDARLEGGAILRMEGAI